MKKIYEAPVVEIVAINAADIIFESGGGCYCNSESVGEA